VLAIHDSLNGFHPRWKQYCEARDIPYRLVDCYASDVIAQLDGCSGLLWHHEQSNPKDVLIAKAVLFALEHAGKSVFPDFRTAWHFDDKIAQKYLFESLAIPAVPSYVFVDRKEALSWISKAKYPLVFKLRRGAASSGVRLVHDEAQARRLVLRAFGRGFSLYDPFESLRERIRKYHQGLDSGFSIIKGLARFVYPPRYTKVLGNESGYAYFQDFVPDNQSDIRVLVVERRAFGVRRSNRPGDFRASGSGIRSYDPGDIPISCIQSAFDISKKIGSACVALDFVIDCSGIPRVIEMSYGSPVDFYDDCGGYWDTQLRWQDTSVSPHGLMVESIIAKL